MNNFKPLALASVVSLMSAVATAGPLNDLLGGGGALGQLDMAARSVQAQMSGAVAQHSTFGTTNTPTLFGVTIFEPANSQNADIAALSIGSGDNTGNGGAVGIAALAGADSGNGGLVGISALNTTETATITAGGEQHGTGNDLAPLTSQLDPYRAGQMNESLYNELGREEVRGEAQTAQLEKQMRAGQADITARMPQGVSTDQAPGFGTAGIGSISGFEGENAGSGSDFGVAVLASGNDSANANLIGAAALTGDNAARGDLVTVAIAGGDNSAQGGLVNIAALSGADSGQGGVVNIQLANQPTTTIGSDEAVLNLAVLHRSDNVEQGTVGIGIITITEDGTPPPPLVETAVDAPASAEAENCGGSQEVMIRGLPVLAGPRLGTQFADPRAETKTGECSVG